jgi:hypothetical protein
VNYASEFVSAYIQQSKKSKYFFMSATAISYLKIFTALSFLCILVVSDKLVLPMLFILLLALGSIITGNPVDFLFSFLIILSVGYLIFSVLADKKIINFVLSTIAVTILTGAALYVLLTRRVVLPTYSIVSFTIFFSFIFAYYVACIGKFWSFQKFL